MEIIKMDGEVVNLKDKNQKFYKSNNSFAKEFLLEALKEETDIKKFKELFEKLKKNTNPEKVSGM